VVRRVGRRPAESAIPTAPEEVTEPLKISVYGLPVTNGVEEQKRPSFETKSSFQGGERHVKRGTNLGRQRKGGERGIETLRGVVRESDNGMHVVFPAISQKMRHGRREQTTKGSEPTQVPLMRGE
jgi:hypothetical protein